MFKDKTEALVVGTKIQRIKAHLQENKNAYFAASGGVAVGALSVLVLKQRPIEIINNVTPVFNNMPVFTNIVNNGVHPGWPTECIETGERTLSQNAMAVLKGVNPNNLSRHLNGDLPHVNGLHFQRYMMDNSVA